MVEISHLKPIWHHMYSFDNFYQALKSQKYVCDMKLYKQEKN